ncbi:hypothetical protein AArcMg_0235 [Natrarchaeobaculum sulfurireducens]|uniref:DUF7973 domain-containing protein n=2 Tax=Natrarchaeobaculum sulfurireducens TaxID=2044521 RepID=A0A346PL63_9EURY|nr:hypothetical protein AArcMg_0235 [Natrarchaeobaculum sulfurireducens]
MFEDLLEALVQIDMLLASFAGGAFGASIGALPAFVFTGLLVIAGEVAAIVHPDAAVITDEVAFGPPFSPAISFGGGAAAVAYAVRRGYVETSFDYHAAKDVTYALGTKPDVLAVGGAFGVLGFWLTELSVTAGMPYDPIAMGVVVSALFHRLVLGYSVIGTVRGRVLDMGPYDRGERRDSSRRTTDGGLSRVESAADRSRSDSSPAADSSRFVVEPWLPHQYRWGHVGAIGVVGGLLGAYIGVVSGSAFLAFGISAATLVFACCGVERIPVTHHITFPASTAALAAVLGPNAVAGPPVPYNETALLAGSHSLEVALVVGLAVGVACALFGELFQRVFYAHGDTHVDPPAAAIVFGTLMIAVGYALGVFPTTVWIPFF